MSRIRRDGDPQFLVSQASRLLSLGWRVQAAALMPAIAKLAGGNSAMLAFAEREHRDGNDECALLLLDASRANFVWLPQATALWARLLIDSGYQGEDLRQALESRHAEAPEDENCSVQLARLYMLQDAVEPVAAPGWGYADGRSGDEADQAKPSSMSRSAGGRRR